MGRCFHVNEKTHNPTYAIILSMTHESPRQSLRVTYKKNCCGLILILWKIRLCRLNFMWFRDANMFVIRFFFVKSVKVLNNHIITTASNRQLWRCNLFVGSTVQPSSPNCSVIFAAKTQLFLSSTCTCVVYLCTTNSTVPACKHFIIFRLYNQQCKSPIRQTAVSFDGRYNNLTLLLMYRQF